MMDRMGGVKNGDKNHIYPVLAPVCWRNLLRSTLNPRSLNLSFAELKEAAI